MKTWQFSPHSGGKTIPPSLRTAISTRLQAHAAKHYVGRYSRLEIKFRGALCYIDAFLEADAELLNSWKQQGLDVADAAARYRERPVHLGRLRHFAPERWSYAFYTYSNERYEPALYPSGEWFGTPEEAFDIGAMYLEN
ncbi:MAG: hypothetical protein HY066_05630 [Betaproteobacteria bacterium]|nr:hypothetical protein [Betaproteobacteria bacterium]